MRPYEILTILISIIALGVSVWNFKRISKLDDKNEYKSKRELFHDTYSELTSLLEKLDGRIHSINEKRSSLFSVDSPYVRGGGYTQGDSFILKRISSTNPIRESLIGLQSELEGITSKEDKQAFDRCMEIKIELKKISLQINEALARAETTINEMHVTAQAQKGNA